MKNLFTAIVVAGMLGASGVAAATITNGSFEEPVAPVGGFATYNPGSGSLTGWTISGASIDHIGAGFWQASDGVQSVDMNGSRGAASLSQMVTGLAVGTAYTLLFDMAGNPSGPPAVKSVDVMMGGASDSFTFDITGHSKQDMGWVTYSLNFVAGATSELLMFKSTTTECCWGPALDNVRIEISPVPVPAGGLLLVSGLAGLALSRRRRKS